MINYQKFHLGICLGLVLLLSNSCQNELDLLASARTIPVVYGLLDITDSLQVVRVEKAFLSDRNAEEVAQIKDSIYFADLEVFINGEMMQVSDGSELFPNRESGTFLAEPNVIYYLERDRLELTPGAEYELSLVQNESEIASAITKLIPSFSVFAPQVGSTLDFNRQNIVFRWADDDLIAGYDVSLELTVLEELNGESQSKKLIWTIEQNYENTRLSFPGNEFFEFVAGSLEAVPGIDRRIQSIYVHVLGAGEAYIDFNRVNQSNQGITGFSSIPNYSNINKGLGLFSSRFTNPGIEVFLNQSSQDSLEMGRQTRDLGF